MGLSLKVSEVTGYEAAAATFVHGHAANDFKHGACKAKEEPPAWANELCPAKGISHVREHYGSKARPTDGEDCPVIVCESKEAHSPGCEDHSPPL